MKRAESDLALLLAVDAEAGKHLAVEGLLDWAFSEDEARSAPAGAARRLLEKTAPAALDFSGALVSLHKLVTDPIDGRIFDALELDLSATSNSSLLADQLGVAPSRVRKRRDRASAQLRLSLGHASAPIGWLVRHTREHVGAASPLASVAALIEALGLPPLKLTERGDVGTSGPDLTTSLLLWCAGPYRLDSRLDGWIVRKGFDLLSIVTELLRADGWVCPEGELVAALRTRGVLDYQVRPVLAACGVAVIDDTCAWVGRGRVSDAVERLLEAAGRSLTALDCLQLLVEAGRNDDLADVDSALRGTRFRALGRGRFELTSWPKERSERHTRARITGKRPSRSQRASVDGSAISDTARLGLYAAEDEDAFTDEARIWRLDCELVHSLSTTDGRLEENPDRVWFVVEVDDQVLSRSDSPAPESVVRALGVGFQQRRTYASRYGPVTISNDGALPSHSSLRPLAFGMGAAVGDRLVLGFSTKGDVVVELQQPILVEGSIS